MGGPWVGSVGMLRFCRLFHGFALFAARSPLGWRSLYFGSGSSWLRGLLWTSALNLGALLHGVGCVFLVGFGTSHRSLRREGILAWTVLLACLFLLSLPLVSGAVAWFVCTFLSAAVLGMMGARPGGGVFASSFVVRTFVLLGFSLAVPSPLWSIVLCLFGSAVLFLGPCHPWTVLP